MLPVFSVSSAFRSEKRENAKLRSHCLLWLSIHVRQRVMPTHVDATANAPSPLSPPPAMMLGETRQVLFQQREKKSTRKYKRFRFSCPPSAAKCIAKRHPHCSTLAGSNLVALYFYKAGQSGNSHRLRHRHRIACFLLSVWNIELM